MGTLLNMGAVEAIDAYGSDRLKCHYLPKLATGEWTASMAITEPDAGSDLSRIKTSARPDDDGTFLIAGTKIFISYGDHDLADNIVHLVLARMVDAPAGVHGLSLFLVPKWLPGDTDDPIANDIACLGIERKLGQHGSPTCVLQFGEKAGARGWLIGDENKGLLAMFTMMNRARLAVATQGVAVAERAFQMTVAHASQRSQGRNLAGKAAVIAEHLDVQRMLGLMMSLASAGRAITLTAADAIDRSRDERTPEGRIQALREADFLTPLAKAFCTDVGCEVASMAIQVHGGSGFIEDVGVARLWRDVRIAPIYEGTNGIQAIDLAGRKLSVDGGETARRLLSSYENDAREADEIANMRRSASLLLAACERTRAAMDHMLLHSGRPQALAGATEFLRLFALTAGAALLTRAYLRAAHDEAIRDHYGSCSRIFAERMLPSTHALSEVILYAAETTADVGTMFASYEGNPIYASRIGL
jgi:acyl-CoA dehydrogenase